MTAPAEAGAPRHLLDIADLSHDQLHRVIELAEVPARELPRVLAGQGAALIFEKASNRTRHSAEMAVVQLGGHPIYTRGDEIDFDRRETVEDATRILAGYHALLGARVIAHSTLERMAAVSPVPVVNLLSDRSHPLQALADVVTMRQLLGPLEGRIVAWVGDYNNVARSLAEACVLLGATLRITTPQGYGPDPDEIDRIDGLGSGSVSSHAVPTEAVADAEIVHTDVWASMGQEAEADVRRSAFGGWQVDDDLMAAAAPGAWFLHCLPAHRGEEVAASVLDGARSAVIRQGHNRLPATRALFAHLLAAPLGPG